MRAVDVIKSALEDLDKVGCAYSIHVELVT